MKLRRIVLTLLLGCFAFGFISCSKESNGISPAPTANRFLKGADGPPIWIVDNVEIGVLIPNQKDSRSRLPKPADIESMTVLSPASTSDLISRYGPNAKNGVFLLTTKKASKKI